MNKMNIVKWGLIIVGLVLVNWFPLIINNPHSGLVLAMGIIFFVNGFNWPTE